MNMNMNMNMKGWLIAGCVMMITCLSGCSVEIGGKEFNKSPTQKSNTFSEYKCTFTNDQSVSTVALLVDEPKGVGFLSLYNPSSDGLIIRGTVEMIGHSVIFSKLTANSHQEDGIIMWIRPLSATLFINDGHNLLTIIGNCTIVSNQRMTKEQELAELRARKAARQMH